MTKTTGCTSTGTRATPSTLAPPEYPPGLTSSAALWSTVTCRSPVSTLCAATTLGFGSTRAACSQRSAHTGAALGRQLNVGGVDGSANPGFGNVTVAGAVRAGGDIITRGNLSWSGDSTGQRFIRLGGLQICWGYGTFVNNGYQENQHDFPVNFAESPAVTVTLNDTGAGVSDPHAAVGAWGRDGRETPDVGGFQGQLQEQPTH